MCIFPTNIFFVEILFPKIFPTKSDIYTGSFLLAVPQSYRREYSPQLRSLNKIQLANFRLVRTTKSLFLLLTSKYPLSFSSLVEPG